MNYKNKKGNKLLTKLDRYQNKYKDKYRHLIEVVCRDIPNFPRVLEFTRKGAEQIINLVEKYFPTKGRRRTAIVVAALGIARGNKCVNDLQDLLHRVKYFMDESIPIGQMQNTFCDLYTFLKFIDFYKQASQTSTKVEKTEIIKKCPECGCTIIVYDTETGEECCSKCGIVLNIYV
jgi:hypothetical protein